MTCFWDGLIKILRPLYIFRSPVDVILYLKYNNKKTKTVLWNNEPLTEKELQENFEAISNLDTRNIRNGYLCSTFDPVLFLISELLEIEIHHKYIDNIIIYSHKNSQKKINVYSNSGHFWV